MASLCYLWEALQKQPQVDSGDEDNSKALRVVRTGLGLSEPGSNRDFWDDFISICGDSEGMSDLLGVSRDEIAQWPTKIIEVKKKADSSEDEEGNPQSKKRELLSTGDADFGTPDNSTADTRPMP